MLKKLNEVAKKSYSPYSKFKVAAILEDKHGKTYSGANMENIAFPSSMCAERVAIGLANMFDVDFKSIIKIHIFSPNADFFLAPCAACRQVMTEHLNINTEVCMYSNVGEIKTMLLKDLVPMPILPQSFLGKN